MVQIGGHSDGWLPFAVISAPFQLPYAQREINNFTNIPIYQTTPVYVDSPILGPRIEQQHIGPLQSHYNLDSQSVWDKNIKSETNNNKQ